MSPPPRHARRSLLLAEEAGKSPSLRTMMSADDGVEQYAYDRTCRRLSLVSSRWNRRDHEADHDDHERVEDVEERKIERAVGGKQAEERDLASGRRVFGGVPPRNGYTCNQLKLRGCSGLVLFYVAYVELVTGHISY